jgi:hypothetical protein
MATKRRYGYYLKGNNLAIVEVDLATTTQTINSEDYGKYKSPGTTIADGIEIQYAYSPMYNIKEDEDYDTTVTKYKSNDGYLQIDGTTNFSGGTPGLTADTSYIVLKNAGRFNGLHRVKSFATVNTTNDSIVLYTRYSGHGSAWVDFEETVHLYYNIETLQDETFNLDLPRYLANAVVYYLKAKVFEDIMDIEKKEYFMREFKRQVEKFQSTRRVGTYRAIGFGMTR